MRTRAAGYVFFQYSEYVITYNVLLEGDYYVCSWIRSFVCSMQCKAADATIVRDCAYIYITTRELFGQFILAHHQTQFIGERERANLVVQLARFFIYNIIYLRALHIP